MHNLFGHPLAKPAGIGLLQLGVLVVWGCGGTRWLLEHYVGWAVQQIQGLSLSAMVPAALAVAGTAVVPVTLQLPPIAVALAEAAAAQARARSCMKTHHAYPPAREHS
jgi:hypothetical protein